MRAQDADALKQAVGALRQGRPAEAVRHLDRLAGDMARHPDALYLRALAERGLGRPMAARPLLEQALQAKSDQPQIWKALADVLDELGDGGAALEALRRATTLAPGYLDAWQDLGVLALRAGDLELAETAAECLRALAPGEARGHALTGSVSQSRGDPAAAEAAFRAALEIEPGQLNSRHNLGSSLRALGRYEAALAEIDTAIAKGIRAPQSFTLRAHLLAEVGRFDEAVEQYRSVLAKHPDMLDAHETLARLLPQIGRDDEALASYRAAIQAIPDSPELYRSAIGSAKAMHDGETMLEWADAALARFGAAPGRQMDRIAALVLLKRWAEADTELTSVLEREPENGAARVTMAHVLIARGDARAAEPHALRASEIQPLDQAAWALLTIIWRLTGDPREQWLADYERLVAPMALEAPPGWRSVEAFLDDAAEGLERLHVTRIHPAEQSLRGGSQTRGNLFERDDPLVRAIQTSIDGAIRRCLADLPVDPNHPFLGRNTGRAAFAGSWSVRLRSEGFHISHIHQQGWLSSACYIGLPPELGDDAENPAGWLQFGVPDAALGLDLAPRRLVRPERGRLVLFPSYFWHGTLPFESASPRLTVAFDALPA